MNIPQARVSPSIPFFKDRFLNRYKLSDYATPFAPAFFFGCYTPADIFAVQWHQSHAVIIWAGSDAEQFRRTHQHPMWRPVFVENVRHVAISDCIAADLDAVGLKYVRLPFCCVQEEYFKPTPTTGCNGLYVFLPDNDPEKYGASFIEELKPLLDPGIELVIHRRRDCTSQEMAAIYARCFAGIRPTKHDGLSNTVVEMLLMGRDFLWNHAFVPCEGGPQSVWTFETPAHAAQQIHRVWDFAQVRDHHERVGNGARKWLQMPPGWNTTEFYFPYDYQTYFDMRYARGNAGAGGPQPGGIEAELTLARVRSVLAEHECETVLEVGCGSCLRWDRLPKGYQGIDVSPLAIQHARAKFPGVPFSVMDATEDEIPQADAVICLDVFQHIKHEDFEPMLTALVNAARKVVIVKTTVDLNENFYQFKHDWSRFEDWTVEPVPGADHARFFIFEKERVLV